VAANFDLSIYQGTTFSAEFRWAALPMLYLPITAVPETTPVQFTCPSHGLTNGWPVAVVSTNGLDELRAQNDPPRPNEYNPVTVIDPNTIELNQVNAAGMVPYVSGGFIQAYSAVPLAGATALLEIKDRIGGTLLESLTSPVGIVLDDTNKLITVNISAAATAAFSWLTGVYDLQLTTSTGEVFLIAYGNVAITDEVSN
jgi:hypothetical protein